MKLAQLQDFKHWHVRHAAAAPLELFVCECVLSCWVLGWTMMPLPLIFDLPEAWALSLLLVLAPEGYHALRARLHHRRVLRCDWLYAAKRTQAE
jgi:hypothetical protein